MCGLYEFARFRRLIENNRQSPHDPIDAIVLPTFQSRMTRRDGGWKPPLRRKSEDGILTLSSSSKSCELVLRSRCAQNCPVSSR